MKKLLAAVLILFSGFAFGQKVDLTKNVTGTLPVANGGTGITALGTGVATALGVNVGSAGAFVVNGGALGSPSSAGTMPAFTLGGTVSGGGNQINNVIIGASTPLAGSFTMLTAGSGLASYVTPLHYLVATNSDALPAVEIRQGRFDKDVLTLTSNQALSALFLRVVENTTQIFSIGTGGNTTIGGTGTFSSTTESSSVSTGAVVISGGLGVAKNAYIGGQFSAVTNSWGVRIHTQSPTVAGLATLDFATQANRALGSQIIGDNTGTGGIGFWVNGANTLALNLASTGAVTIPGTLGVTGAITGGGYSGGAISGTTGSMSSYLEVAVGATTNAILYLTSTTSNGYGAFTQATSKTGGGVSNTWKVGTNISGGANAWEWYDGTASRMSIAIGGAVTIPGTLGVTGATTLSYTASPASGAACTAGTQTWDANYFYICTASGAWKRAALTGGY